VLNLKVFDFVILIPVFQDDDKIIPLKEQLDKFLYNKDYFICFVDDSDSEKTSNIIKEKFKDNFFIIKRKKFENFSTRFSASFEGFKWIIDNVKSNYVVEIDADLSHHPKDITKGINILKTDKFDLVIGSKYLANSVVRNRKLLRVIISKFMTMTCQILFDSRISDYTNTFRFYNYSLIKSFTNQKLLFKSPIGHLNNLLFIIKNKYLISEIPVEYIETNINSTIKKSSLIRYFIEFLFCVLINKFKKK